MKNLELRLLTELMKNSHRNDRELSKKLGISQPMITRTRKKLENEGYIKEYTIIPDFKKLGFQLVSFTLARLKKSIPESALTETRKKLYRILQKENVSDILTMRFRGADFDYITIAFHENYEAYLGSVRRLRQMPMLEVAETRSFVASLSESHFRPLTFSILAEYAARMNSNKNHQSTTPRRRLIAFES